jgi:competence protein ComEC
LVPLLAQMGERIDTLMLSHRDSDHVGGAAAVMRALPVGELLSSLEADHPLVAQAGARARPCEVGQHWTWDGVEFEVLHPGPLPAQRPRKPNAVSCVLRVSGPQGRVLLTGDIEREQELQLLAQPVLAARLRSEVLLVPHHGSRTSSSAGFLDAVGAEVALVQAGYRNRYGHPVAEVLGRLQERSTRVVQSTACGAWHWDGAASAVQGVCQRQWGRRYWHHGAGGVTVEALGAAASPPGSRPGLEVAEHAHQGEL